MTHDINAGVQHCIELQSCPERQIKTSHYWRCMVILKLDSLIQDQMSGLECIVCYDDKHFRYLYLLFSSYIFCVCSMALLWCNNMFRLYLIMKFHSHYDHCQHDERSCVGVRMIQCFVVFTSSRVRSSLHQQAGGDVQGHGTVQRHHDPVQTGTPHKYQY